MESIQLNNFKISFNDDYDVIVAGGGPSGCTAAAAAAREGARTLLLEATSALGGISTSGMINAWAPFSDKKKIIYRGLAERILMQSKEDMPHVPEKKVDWVPINHEKLKRIYDMLMCEYDVNVLFNTQVSAVQMRDSENIDYIIVSNKSGLTAYSAKVYIDCTGDGDVAFWAGAKYQMRKLDELQPATHCFVLANVDEYAYRTGERLHANNPDSIIYDILRSGEFPLIPDAHVNNVPQGPGVVGFNAGHIFNIDNTNPQNVSKGLVKGRELAEEFRKALTKYYPRAYANSYLVSTGALLGIRETRRIIGDYILTKEDYMERKTFPDEISRNSYFVDIHLTKKETERHLKEGIYLSFHSSLAYEKRKKSYQPGESHGIPYRCLTPKGLKNVLVAGRAISCDSVVFGSIRTMPNCMATGEAAGLAAYEAMNMNDIDVHSVNIKTVREKLLKYGAYIK